jgi:hypothetical protein
VRAQTQPGTGVIIFPIFSMISKSASPYILPSITVNQTSITVVPILTISTFNK